MKKITTRTSLFGAALAFAAVMFAASLASAQDVYHPITNGCIWSVSNEKYMTSGDTLLGGKTYLKLYRQVGNQSFEVNLEEAEYFAAICNDSVEKKVFAFLPEGTWIRNLDDYSEIQIDTTMEVLLYDFSLKIGDTVCYYSLGKDGYVAKSYAVRAESANIYVGQHDNSAVTHQYSTADTLVYLSDNSSRSQIFLQGLSYLPNNNVWIEGIGGIRGFDEEPQMNLSDYGQRILLCFSDSFGVTFQTEFDFDEDSDDCFSNGFGGDVKEHSPSVTSVYPNPTDDLLFVELHGAEIARVALYDLQGRTMMGAYDTPQLTNTTTLNVKSLPAGVYVLHVKDADGREYQQKVVRK